MFYAMYPSSFCTQPTRATIFSEIFVIVLISDVTFITKFKKLNNWRCTVQHAGLARFFRN